MLDVIHNIIRKAVYLYIKGEERSYLKNIVCSGGVKRSICIKYPAFIGPQEYITIGENTTVLAYSRLQVYRGENNGRIEIGNNCFLGYRLSILASEKVKIGNNVLMASDISIVTHNHGINPELKMSYAGQPLSAKEIVIGDNVWIGDKAVILPGVTIGKGSVIGAGSIVTKSIPEYCVAVGNPAKIVKKYNFSEHIWEKIQ